MGKPSCPKCRTPLIRTTAQILCPKGCYSAPIRGGGPTDVTVISTIPPNEGR